MRNLPHLLPLLLALVLPAYGQDTEPASWLPGGNLFPPLIAPTVEPRAGMLVLKDVKRLRLDIGRSVDLYAFPTSDDGRTEVTAGADFFTWTSLRQADDFHFPVDAVDYLFGINFNARHAIDDVSALSARLRISHISAHLVDGSYDKLQGVWRNGQLPRVYSREFFDLVCALQWTPSLRVYAGGQYVYHIDPADLGHSSLQTGVEYSMPVANVPWLNLYAAYDFRLAKLHAYAGNHTFQAGVKAGEWNGRGLNIFLSWFSGTSDHGEYYDARWTSWGWGFTVDL